MSEFDTFNAKNNKMTMHFGLLLQLLIVNTCFCCRNIIPKREILYDGCYDVIQTLGLIDLAEFYLLFRKGFVLGNDEFCGCKICISLQGDCDNDNQCDYVSLFPRLFHCISQ